jgi:hypothetical protein
MRGIKNVIRLPVRSERTENSGGVPSKGQAIYLIPRTKNTARTSEMARIETAGTINYAKTPSHRHP